MGKGRQSMGFCYPEYARLRTVLMHSPGKELELVRQTTYTKFLFADAVDPEQFRADHQRFSDALRSEGVNVLLLNEVLHDHPLPKAGEQLPNLVYIRDTGAVTRAGYILARMKSTIRRAETRLVEAALHRLAIPMLNKTRAPATVEGGDFVFMDDDTLLLGVGNRTNQKGLRQLLAAATKSGLLRLVAIPLPSSVIHLDGTMMVIDRDLAVVHERSLRSHASVFENGKLTGRLMFLRFLRKSGIKLITVTDYERQRRATNLIAISPRKAVGYAGNSRVRREFARNGVDMIEIEEAELIRGSGGPRCMTLPVSRD